MNKRPILLLAVASLVFCGYRNSATASSAEEVECLPSSVTFEYDSSGIPLRKVFDAAQNRENCFFVISKVHPEHLSVYEVVDADTVILAYYPVCIAINKGQKQMDGDCKTPESFPGEPFYISEIKDASSWRHDFGDDPPRRPRSPWLRIPHPLPAHVKVNP